MNTAIVQAFESIIYAQISAMGMVAENEYRARRNEAQAWDESAFATLAEKMRGEVRDRLQWSQS